MSIYDISFKNRAGEDISMADFKGKVIIIVNTATGCGFTPQYEGIEKLYEKYHADGLEVLDFPCNQFGHQAPGIDDEIHTFCTAKYQTQFDQMSKIEVNGEKAHPLFALLKTAQPNDPEPKGVKNKLAMAAISKMPGVSKETGAIKWNFTKFVIDREGNIAGRFGPTDEPSMMEDKIKELL